MDVRRPPRVGMVQPRICAGFYREIAVFAPIVGHAAPGAREVGIERRVMLIDGMTIASSCIGLPDLDQRVRNGFVIFIQNPADDDDAFAQCLLRAAGISREIVLVCVQFNPAKKRAGDFGQSLLDRHELLERPAFDRRAVSFETIRWMGSPVARVIFGNLHEVSPSESICFRCPSLYKSAWQWRTPSSPPARRRRRPLAAALL